MSARRPYIPEGYRDNQGRAPAPAEACSEISAKPPERMGPMHGWERFWIRNGGALATGVTFLVAIAGALALFK